MDRDAYAGLVASGRGLACLLAEDRAGARRHFEEALAIIADAAEIRPQLWWGLLVVMRAVDGGDVVALADQIESCPAVVYRGNAVAVRMANAILTGRSRDGDNANRLLPAHGPDMFSPWQRHLLLRLAAEAALADGWGAPQRWLVEAAAFFDEFGSPAVAAACRRLIEGARRPTQQDALVARYGVSPREFDVLELAVDGLSTRDIADRLFISPRTAEKHLESIYGKLGVRGRTQLAGVVLRDTAPAGAAANSWRSRP